MKNSIDVFISTFPKETQNILEQVRQTIKKAAPDAEETICCGIPTFTFHGNLVHFSAFKKHIGFYPTPSGVSFFKKELACYKCAKGSIQFPLDKPLPLDLIRKIVQFRVQENLKRHI
jgi:uncharacterized protein YdhG (YjbR/CyaY superfamily)